jgi:hypothetical protein
VSEKPITELREDLRTALRSEYPDWTADQVEEMIRALDRATDDLIASRRLR